MPRTTTTTRRIPSTYAEVEAIATATVRMIAPVIPTLRTLAREELIVSQRAVYDVFMNTQRGMTEGLPGQTTDILAMTEHSRYDGEIATIARLGARNR